MVRAGNYLSVACAANGITMQTLYNWVNFGESGKPGSRRYKDFFVAVHEAEAMAHAEGLDNLKVYGAGDWKAVAWWLQHRFPKLWSEKGAAQALPPSLDPNVLDGGEPQTVQARVAAKMAELDPEQFAQSLDALFGPPGAQEPQRALPDPGIIEGKAEEETP